ncbi:F-box protein 21 [Gryganskiella cystojenkinii]|nr:F-box protein 21 [Gryganskiella cystojenkinii]
MSKGKERKQSPVLPDDCVFEVFRCLAATDLTRASETCRAWYKLSKKNSLWMQLCLDRWRTWPPPLPFSSYYDPSPTPSQSEHTDVLEELAGNLSLRTVSKTRPPFPPEFLPDLHSPKTWYSAPIPPYCCETWKQVYQERHEKDSIVRMLLKEMVEDSRNRMRHLDGIASIGMVHARDVLQNIITGTHGEEKNLTRTFYARKTLKRLQRGWVVDQWRAYRQNEQNFPIWQGYGLMAMFADHELELSHIDRQFQDLADEFLTISPLPEDQDAATPVVVVLDKRQGLGLSEQYYGSSVHTDFGHGNGRGHEEQSLDQTAEKYARHYDHQVQRLKDLVRFFTWEKEFKGNTENYYDPFNSFIDKVLTRKVGIPISLCVVFSELARRVGIAGVELMGFPQHFMIRYQPTPPGLSPRPDLSPSLAQSLEPRTYYLDLFHPPHRLLSNDEYDDYFKRLGIQSPPDIYRTLPTPPLEIFLRCLRNIILAVERTGGAGRSHHVYGYGRSGLHAMADHISLPSQEKVRILRAQIRELEMADEAGDVGSIRRRRRPKVVEPQRPLMGLGLMRPTASSESEISTTRRGSIGAPISRETEVTASSPRIDSHPMDAPRQQQRRESISGEQQQQSIQAHFDDSERTGQLSGSSSTQHSAPTERNARPPEPVYYVGEVFRHKIYRYTGVIYGYDLKCEAEEGWIRSMSVDTSLAYGRHQPFYTALLSDGSRRYVAQENIQVLFREYRRESGTIPLADQILGFGQSSSSTGATSTSAGAASSQGQGNTITPATATITTASVPSNASNVAVASTLDVESPSIFAGESMEVDGAEDQAANVSGTGVQSSTDSGSVATAGQAPPLISPLTLQFSELGPLGIEAVGQYFEAWDGHRGHYVMNRELVKVYPTEDYL